MITLAGTIGAGKTEWGKKIANHFGSELIEEEVDNNPFLEDYYGDGAGFSFKLQIFFLNHRFKAIKQALKNPNAVLDRSIYEDGMVFAKLQYQNGSMDKAEYDTYVDLHDNMMQEIHDLYEQRITYKKSPDLLILIHGSFDEVLRRVRSRNRPYEQYEDDPELLQYYKDLYEIYDTQFVEEYQKREISPVYLINIDKYDTNSEEDVQKIMKEIEVVLESSRGYSHV